MPDPIHNTTPSAMGIEVENARLRGVIEHELQLAKMLGDRFERLLGKSSPHTGDMRRRVVRLQRALNPNEAANA